MYTLQKDTEITPQVLREAIKYNETLKARYDLLEAYYIGNQAILARKKGEQLSNNRVMVNHAKYIVDTNTGYLLGNPVEYQVTDGKNIEPLLDCYAMQTINDLDSEIAKDVSILGLQYEYVYATEESEPRSAEIDNRCALLVYDTSLEHKKLFGLIYREVFEGKKFTGYDVIYCDKETVRTYFMAGRKGGDLALQKEEKHVFGDVPLIEYKNNPDYQGDFEPVTTLIDAYNVLQSDRVNDKEQLVDAILCIYALDFTAEQMEELKLGRVISGIPPEARVEYLTKSLNESDTDVLRQNLESDIHKISMTPNMSDQNFIGNSSGVAIKYKLLAFEQNISNKERYMEKGLMERFKLYNNFLSTASRMEVVPIHEVDAVFKRNLPQNDFETSQMITNLSGLVDKETLVAQLSFIKDAKEIVALAESEEKEKTETPEVLDYALNTPEPPPEGSTSETEE